MFYDIWNSVRKLSTYNRKKAFTLEVEEVMEVVIHLLGIYEKLSLNKDILFDPVPIFCFLSQRIY